MVDYEAKLLILLMFVLVAIIFVFPLFILFISGLLLRLKGFELFVDIEGNPDYYYYVYYYCYYYN